MINHILSNRNYLRSILRPQRYFLLFTMLFNRDTFGSTCNVLFQKTNIDTFYLFQLTLISCQKVLQLYIYISTFNKLIINALVRLNVFVRWRKLNILFENKVKAIILKLLSYVLDAPKILTDWLYQNFNSKLLNNGLSQKHLLRLSLTFSKFMSGKNCSLLLVSIFKSYRKAFHGLVSYWIKCFLVKQELYFHSIVLEF